MRSWLCFREAQSPGVCCLSICARLNNICFAGSQGLCIDNRHCRWPPQGQHCRRTVPTGMLLHSHTLCVSPNASKVYVSMQVNEVLHGFWVYHHPQSQQQAHPKLCLSIQGVWVSTPDLHDCERSLRRPLSLTSVFVSTRSGTRLGYCSQNKSISNPFILQYRTSSQHYCLYNR